MKEDLLTNFIPINRKLFEHYLWCEEREYSKFEAWLFLMKEARFEDTKLLDKGKLVLIKRGQVYVSIRFLSNSFGWTRKRVETFIKLLVSDGMIKTETVKETGQGMITICNYDKYNVMLSDKETAKETTRRHCGDTAETKSNKENKENKDKERGENKAKRFTPPTVENIIDFLKTLGEPNPKSMANNFFNFYESNDWKVGRNKMKNWQASARNWQSREFRDFKRPNNGTNQQNNIEDATAKRKQQIADFARRAIANCPD